MIRVLVVDDDHLIRQGITRLLGDLDDFEIAGACSSGEEALEFISENKVDIVLLDLNMPGWGGLETTRRLHAKRARLKIIIVTVCKSNSLPKQLFKAGAMGYLTKGCDIEEMTRAIKEAHCGRKYISVEIAQGMAVNLHSEEVNVFERLSQREMQVLMMILQGSKSSFIAESLSLSPKTISTYRTRILEKLQVKGDMELTRLAMHYHLIDAL